MAERPLKVLINKIKNEIYKNQKYFKGAQNKNGQGETSSDDGLLYEEVICIPINLNKYLNYFETVL